MSRRRLSITPRPLRINSMPPRGPLDLCLSTSIKPRSLCWGPDGCYHLHKTRTTMGAHPVNWPGPAPDLVFRGFFCFLAPEPSTSTRAFFFLFPPPPPHPPPPPPPRAFVFITLPPTRPFSHSPACTPPRGGRGETLVECLFFFEMHE